MIAEHPLALEITEIRANFIEAGIQIVPAAIGGIYAIVADGVQAPGHGGVFFVGILDRLRRVDVGGVAEQIVDLLHQHIGCVQDHDHNRAHAQNEENAPQQACDDLAQALLLASAQVKGFPHHGGNAEAEAQHNADQRHAPVNIADDRIVEEDVDEIVLLAVVGHLVDPGENAEHLVQPSHDLTKAVADVVAQLVDRGVQYCFQTVVYDFGCAFRNVFKKSYDFIHGFVHACSPSFPLACAQKVLRFFRLMMM